MAVEFHHATLPNGLTIVGEVDPDAHTAGIGFFVRTGARDEATPVMGVSHFLEHMMFKGTPHLTADDINQSFDDIGANYNAFTSHEMTAFWAHVLPEHLDRAEEVLAEMLRPALREEDFQLERNVILEEIAMYEDNPFWVLYEATMEQYYGPHPLHHRVLGTQESIRNLTRDRMLEYFLARYSADNTVVAYAGAVDFPARVEALARRCGGWQRTGVTRSYPPLVPSRRTFAIESPKVNQSYLLAVSPAPAVQDPDRYATAVLAQILGDSEGSRLYWALIETGLAEEAVAQFEAKDRAGEMFVYASCAPDALAEVEAVIRREMSELLPSIEPDDLERVRAKIATSVTLAGERPAGRMRRLGRLWAYLHEYRSLEEELDRIEAVTLDDLHRVARRFPIEPLVVGRLHPAG